MKPLNLITGLSICLLFVACTQEEPMPPVQPTCTTGTLRCTNTSVNTVQRILISGTNYGTIDPNEYRDISLAPGSWNLQFQGISGGSGCSSSSFNIAACQSIGRTCSN